MKVYLTSRFTKSFKKLPREIQTAAIKKDKIFRLDPFARQLRTHKLKGKLSRFYSYSVKYEWRVVFEFVNKDKVIYQDIGTHEVYG